MGLGMVWCDCWLFRSADIKCCRLLLIDGGLVGVWFLFDSGLVIFSNETPYYLLGAAKELPNPIGGVIGITALFVILIFQRRLFSRTGRFLDLTVKASLRDEIP